MQNFQYYTPTKVVFGKETELQAGRLLKEFGATKVLIVYGGGSAVRSGLLDRVGESVREAGIPYVTLGGVQPNPRLGLARKGIELCREEGVDFMLAVGGGSVIDTAKCIAYGIANDGDVWDFYCKKRVPAACAPVGAVLTIAAAGSEMSYSSVITNEDGMIKRGCNTDLGRPRFAIMNPELTMTLPPYQTACGCVDIMMHTFERYFTLESDTTLMDQMAEGLLRTVMTDARILKREPDNYGARSQVMWAGSLAHNGLLGCGMVEDWGTHQLGHELSAMFDVAHGASLSAVWGSWARYVMDAKPERFAQYAANVMGIPWNCSDLSKMALRGIEAMETFFHEIDMPASIPELGIELNDEIIHELSRKCTNDGGRIIGGFKKLETPQVEEIYHMAWEAGK